MVRASGVDYWELIEEGKPYREWCVPAESLEPVPPAAATDAQKRPFMLTGIFVSNKILDINEGATGDDVLELTPKHPDDHGVDLPQPGARLPSWQRL